MSIRVNGSTVTRAYYRQAGSWRALSAAWAKKDGVWLKVFPYVPPSPPITGASISPTSRTWTQNAANDFRASFTGSASGGTGPFYYNWSVNGGATILSGQGTANVVVRSTTGNPATVFLTVDDQGSGTSAAAASRPINSIPVVQPLGADISPGLRRWAGSPGAFTAAFTGSGSGGSGSYGYNWSVSGGTIQSGQGTPNVTVASSTGGAATVSLTLSDLSLGSSTTASASVSAAMAVSVSPSSLSGSGQTNPVETSGSASVSISGGSGSRSIEWVSDGSGTGGIEAVSASASTTKFRATAGQALGTTRTGGFYARVTDLVTGEVRETTSVSISLTRGYAALSAFVSPSALSGAGTSAPVQTVGQATVSVSGGSGSFSYLWYYDGTGTGGLNPVSQAAVTRFASGSDMPAGATYTAGFYCQVTDTVTGLTANTNSVSVTLSRNYVALSATATPGSLSGSSVNTPVVTSGSATCTVTGGSGSFSYSWEWDGSAASGAIDPTNRTSATTTFQSGDTQAPGTTRGAGMRCRVTDLVTGQVVVSNSVGVNLTRTAVPLTVSISPPSQPWPDAPPYRVTFTATASGGVAPYVYGWNDTGPQPVPPGNYGGATKTWESVNGREQAFVSVVVTDATGAQATTAADITYPG